MQNNSGLLPRVLTAVVGVPVLIGICVWGAVPFALFTLLLAFIGRTELQRAYEKVGILPNHLLTLVGALSPLTIFFLGRGTLSTPLFVVLILICSLIAASLWETARASHTEEIHTGRNMAYGLLCGIYVSLFGGVALLRICPWHGNVGYWPRLDSGACLVLLTAACTITSDSAAYFVGRALGKHKLAEGLSPKKTIEGFLGGVVASVIVGGAVGELLLRTVPFGLIVGALASILSPMGDLFKSALKREIGIKDFGALLPGHGGVLDRFDSLLFTAPVIFVIVTTIGPWHDVLTLR